MRNAATILAENLANLFDEKKMSANQVGVSTGVGQTTISGWLRKARDSDPNFNPRIPQLEAVAKHLGVTVSQLFEENLGRLNKQGTQSATVKSPVFDPRLLGAISAHGLSQNPASLQPQQEQNSLIFAAMCVNSSPHVSEETKAAVLALLNALASPPLR